MSRTAMLAVATLPVLWAGKLLPRVPEAQRTAAVAAWALGLVLWAVWVQVAVRDAPGGSGLGPWRARWIPMGLAAAVALFVVAAAGYAASEGILGLSPPPEQALVPDRFGPRLALLLVAVGAAAGLEEWVFRGELLRALTAATGTPTAVLVSSVLFGLYHLSPFQLLPTLLLGLGLATLVAVTGAVWPAVVAHLAFNLLGVAASVTGARPPG